MIKRKLLAKTTTILAITLTSISLFVGCGSKETDNASAGEAKSTTLASENKDTKNTKENKETTSSNTKETTTSKIAETTTSKSDETTSTKVEEVKQVAANEKKSTMYIVSSSANVRSSADGNSEKLGKLSYKNEITVLGDAVLSSTNEKWFKIEYNGGFGYVFADLVGSEQPKDAVKNNSQGNTSNNNSQPQQVADNQVDNSQPQDNGSNQQGDTPNDNDTPQAPATTEQQTQEPQQPIQADDNYWNDFYQVGGALGKLYVERLEHFRAFFLETRRTQTYMSYPDEKYYTPQWSDELFKLAQIRADELNQSFCHESPNGTLDGYNVNENICSGNLDWAETGWTNSSSHYFAMCGMYDLYAVAEGEGGSVLLLANSSDWKIEPYVESGMNKIYEEDKKYAIENLGATEDNWRDAFNQFYPYYNTYYERTFNSSDEFYEFERERAINTFTSTFGTRK